MTADEDETVKAEQKGETKPPSSDKTLFAPGTVLLDKYHLEGELGRGAMGAVIAAHHIGLDEKVAIKFILPEYSQEPDVVMRFVREARAAARIRSEHVARVTDVDKLPSGQPYMVMEHLEGEDLKKLLAREGPLPITDAVDWLLQAMEAIAEAHALGIVHRDLKPANLFMTRRPDGTPCVKVLDFGISKFTHHPTGTSIHQTQGAIGTPLYMSPEQLMSSAEVDARTDVWALGVMLYELLTAVRPFQAPGLAQVTLRVCRDVPESIRTLRPEVPESLERVLLRCLEKDREQRYPNLGELAVDLREHGSKRARASAERVAGVLAVELPVSLPPPPPSGQPVTVKIEKQGARWPFVVALVLLSIVLAIFAMRK